MRLLLVILLLSGIGFSQVCVSCNELADAPEANLFTTLENEMLTIYASYDNNTGGQFIREPIDNAILIVEPYNDSHGQLGGPFRVYTDDEGRAEFNFGNYADGCVNFKVLYCPFCNPDSPACGFEACMEYSGMETDATTANELDLAPGAEVRSPLNDKRFMPAISQEYYCPPPPPLGATPSICFPLLLIFSLLAGSMYMTGRNPFAGFNIGGARMGRHIRYQARGRSFSASAMALASAAISIGQAAKAAKAGNLADMEKRAARNRYFGANLISSEVGVRRGISARRGARRAANTAGNRAAAEAKAKGASADGIAQARRGAERKAFSRHMEARSSIISVEDDQQRRGSMTGIMTGSGMAFLPGGGGVRAEETVQSNSGFWGNLFGTMGRMTMIIATQTTIGRVVDGFMFLHNRQGALERMGITNYEKRVGEDLHAIRDMSDEGGLIVQVGDTQMVVRNARADVEGNTVYNVLIPTAEGETTERTVTINKQGTVVAMTYEMTLTEDMARQVPGAQAGQAVTVEMRKGEVTFNPGTAQSFTIDRNNDPVLYDDLAGASRTPGYGFNVGADASEFQNTHRQNSESFGALAAAAGMDASIAQMHAGEDISSQIEKDPDSRQVVRNQRQNMATDDMATLLATDPHTMDSMGDMSARKGEQSKFGDRSQTEVATMRVAEAYRNADVGGREFTDNIKKASGFNQHDPNGVRVAAATQEFVQSSSASELAGMNEDQVRANLVEGVARGLTQQGVHPETARIDAERIVSETNIGNVTQAVNGAGSSLIQQFENQGFNQETVQRLAQADVSHVGQVAQTGMMMSDDRVADVVSHQPTTDYRFNPEMQAKIDQYRIYGGVQQDIQAIGQSAQSGQYAAAAESQNRAVETQNLYLHAKASEQIVQDPQVPTTTETVTINNQQRDMTISDQYMAGTEMAYEGSRRLHRMRQPGDQGYDAAVHGAIADESQAVSTIAQGAQTGNYDFVSHAAEERARYHLQNGNDAAAQQYFQIAEQAQSLNEASRNLPENPPPDQVSQLQEQHRDLFNATQSMNPDSNQSMQYACARTGAIQYEASRELSTRTNIAQDIATGDFGTAISTASQRYRYHREQGNEAEAEHYQHLIEEAGRLRAAQNNDEANQIRTSLYQDLGVQRVQHDPSQGPERGPTFAVSTETQQDVRATATRTYSTAVNLGGEGYGHIIDSADRAGRLAQNDSEDQT